MFVDSMKDLKVKLREPHVSHTLDSMGEGGILTPQVLRRFSK
jgi:hypothetical protein